MGERGQWQRQQWTESSWVGCGLGSSSAQGQHPNGRIVELAVIANRFYQIPVF